MAKLTTEAFRGTPTGYVRRVAVMLLARWWWAVAIPVAACLILSMHEAVWLFVAMMLIFLLYPGLTMMIYFNYAFSPEAQRTLYEQTVSVDNKSIDINYIEKNISLSVNADDISGIEFNAKDILVKLKKPRYNHISIPLSAIGADVQQEFIDAISKFSPTVA